MPTFALVFAVLVTLAALVVVALGMTTKWRGRRTEYFTTPKVVLLLAALGAGSAGFALAGWAAVSLGAAIVAGWILIEAIFAVVTGRLEKRR